ncbi:DUF2939 domain-containing protein [Pseudoduganella flava]|nr:DUF2939 domain-containing protein [Pseudoduganella flava]
MLNQRTLVKVVPVLLLLLAAYWYFSPYLAFHALRDAARRGDVAALAEHVDFPKVRADLKVQLNAMMTDSLRDLGAGGNGVAEAGAAFGAMLGSLMTDKLVDVMITPEYLAYAVRVGKTKNVEDDRSAPPVQAEEDGDDVDEKWLFERAGVNRLVVLRHDEGSGSSMGYVLERTGFAQWKLVGIDLPKPTHCCGAARHAPQPGAT